MNKAHGFLSSAVIYTVANVINAGIPFLLLPVLTRVLSPSDYGTVAMFGVVVSVLGILTGLSVQGVISIRYFERDKVDLPRFIASCFTILVVSTSVVLLLVALFHQLLTDFTKVPQAWLIIAVMVSGAQFAIQIRLVLWQSARQPWKYASLQIGQSALNAGLSLWLVLGFGMAWEGRLIGNSGAVLVFFLIAFWGLWNDGWIKFPARKHYVVDALKFGVPLIPHIAGLTLISMADRFIITNELGVSQTGIYVVALQLGMVLGLISDAFLKAYSPWLYEKLNENSSHSAKIVVGASYLVFVFFIALFGFSWLILWLAFDLLVPSGFSEAKELIVWFLLGHAFKGMYYTVSGIFFFKSQTKSLSLITISIGVAQICLTWLLVQRYGIEAAAIVFASSNALMFFLVWIFSTKLIKLPWGELRVSLVSLRHHK